MSIAALQNQLSTPAGFAAAVKQPKGLLTGAIASLVVAAAGIGMNLFQLGSASNWNWMLIERYFLSPDAVTFEGRRSAVSEFWRYLYVWAPLVLIPLGIVLLVIYFATKKSAGAKLFAEFQQRGWVGVQRSLGLNAMNGNKPAPLVLIGRADAPAGTVDEQAMHFGGWVASLDKKSLKQLSGQATKAGAIKGVSASAVHANLPADMVVAATQKDGELVVVIPPASGATKGFKVLPIKGQSTN
ncbi:hypothetical protein FVP60_04330 [Microbacterium mitrae]|uniref:Uncharacterized protein n=1 Tax=Microbacterium mitrae TaxID=664640 RepID=A0A5C8HSD6_9MICO|nr:hypothetical protein [Microbacterium mitrae]TXK06192.1 hypothetical protein FVP60_04330 [Microbacterium mitrae]